MPGFHDETTQRATLRFVVCINSSRWRWSSVFGAFGKMSTNNRCWWLGAASGEKPGQAPQKTRSQSRFFARRSFVDWRSLKDNSKTRSQSRFFARRFFVDWRCLCSFSVRFLHTFNCHPLAPADKPQRQNFRFVPRMADGMDQVFRGLQAFCTATQNERPFPPRAAFVKASRMLRSAGNETAA